jgi:hypothetical protein
VSRSDETKRISLMFRYERVPSTPVSRHEVATRFHQSGKILFGIFALIIVSAAGTFVYIVSSQVAPNLLPTPNHSNDFSQASAAVWSGPSTHRPHMTITELRNIAEGLAKRASRVTAGRKQDSINRGWLAIEKLYEYARATLPPTVVGLSLKDEPETWVNIARLATAIVTACDHAEPPELDEIPGDYGA